MQIATHYAHSVHLFFSRKHHPLFLLWLKPNPKAFRSVAYIVDWTKKISIGLQLPCGSVYSIVAYLFLSSQNIPPTFTHTQDNMEPANRATLSSHDQCPRICLFRCAVSNYGQMMQTSKWTENYPVAPKPEEVPTVSTAISNMLIGKLPLCCMV